MIMKENSSKGNFVSESIHPSISVTALKNWQAPKLIEIDYMETNEGGSGADDGTVYGEPS